MPSESTLAENMRGRCPGKVLRGFSSAVGNRSVVVRFQLAGYEFLPETIGGSVDFARMSALRERHHEETGAHKHGTPTSRSLLP